MNSKEINQNLVILHKLELENLDTLMSICEKYNLRYYLIGGSLIGALRHQGFIPWDDDMDIGMPRTDYNKFVKIALKELPDFMDIRTMIYDSNYECYNTRLSNKKKMLYYDYGRYVEKRGVWIDVFPLDGIPNKVLKRKLHILNVNIHKAIYKLSQIKYIAINKKRPLYKKIVIKCAMLTHIEKLINAEKAVYALDRVFQKYDYETASKVVNFWGSYGKREIVPKMQLGGNRQGIFEGRKVSIPIEAENYLNSIYGNWRELPPVEKRGGHPIRFVEKE